MSSESRYNASGEATTENPHPAATPITGFQPKTSRMVAEDEQVTGAGVPRIRPKKGSVFPAKRTSVKKMMLDVIIESIFSCFKPEQQPPPSRTLHDLKKNNGAGSKEKSATVFPNS